MDINEIGQAAVILENPLFKPGVAGDQMLKTLAYGTPVNFHLVMVIGEVRQEILDVYFYPQRSPSLLIRKLYRRDHIVQL